MKKKKKKGISFKGDGQNKNQSIESGLGLPHIFSSLAHNAACVQGTKIEINYDHQRLFTPDDRLDDHAGAIQEIHDSQPVPARRVNLVTPPCGRYLSGYHATSARRILNQQSCTKYIQR